MNITPKCQRTEKGEIRVLRSTVKKWHFHCSLQQSSFIIFLNSIFDRRECFYLYIYIVVSAVKTEKISDVWFIGKCSRVLFSFLSTEWHNNRRQQMPKYCWVILFKRWVKSYRLKTSHLISECKCTDIAHFFEVIVYWTIFFLYVLNISLIWDLFISMQLCGMYYDTFCSQLKF